MWSEYGLKITSYCYGVLKFCWKFWQRSPAGYLGCAFFFFLIFRIQYEYLEKLILTLWSVFIEGANRSCLD